MKDPSNPIITVSVGIGSLFLRVNASQASVGIQVWALSVQRLSLLVLNSASGVNNEADFISSADNMSPYDGFAIFQLSSSL